MARRELIEKMYRAAEFHRKVTDGAQALTSAVESANIPGLDPKLVKPVLGVVCTAAAALGAAEEGQGGFLAELGFNLLATAISDRLAGMSAGGAPRPEADGAGGARSEDTLVKFPEAKSG